MAPFLRCSRIRAFGLIASSIAVAAAYVHVAAKSPQSHPETAPKETQKIKPGAVHFVDIAARSGLTALNVSGSDTHKEFIIETTGNGAIIFDYDNDGWPDVFLPNGSRVEGFPKGEAPTGHLYH